MPFYAKYHSMGEFIFDHSWADFSERVLGLPYYPKFLSAVPFTPATGPRILLSPTLPAEEQETLRLSLATFIQNLAHDNKVSSVNVNFCETSETKHFLDLDYKLRQTIQYRFQNLNRDTGAKYTSFENYLDCFKSKRRMQIRRERRSVYDEQAIKVEVIRGDSPEATPELYDTMFQLYTTTIDKMWGQQYLNSEFFQTLSRCDPDFRRHLLFIVAKNTTGGAERIIAGTINMVSETHFYGRYWGAFEFAKNLHFECCYYRSIQYCIENGLEYLEPGAGGGEFKFLRGFDAFLVNSVHHFTSRNLHSAVSDFLDEERARNQQTQDYLVANSAVRGRGDDADASERVSE